MMEPLGSSLLTSQKVARKLKRIRPPTRDADLARFRGHCGGSHCLFVGAGMWKLH